MATDIGRITVPIDHAASHITATVNVIGLRTFSVRVRFGLLVMRLAAWILPFETNVEVRFARPS